MEFVWILLAGGAALAATLGLVKAAERRRARLLKEAGTKLGLRAFQRREPLLLPSVEIMRKRGRAVGAALEGSWRGEPIMVFDLSYPAGRNISRTTVLVLRLPRAGVSEFAAIRKNINLYMPKVDLPQIEDPPVSLIRHWLLYAPGRVWPFGDAITDFLALNRRWSYEGHGSAVFVYQRAKRPPWRKLGTWLDEIFTEARELEQRILR
jgi:hypothetical protein